MSPTVLVSCCLLALASSVAAQNCSDMSCTGNLNCMGFQNKMCTNATGTYAGSLSCYASADCANYTSVSGDITITLNGAGPNVIAQYYTFIQSAVLNAYNSYCKSGMNYQSCCPGASAWPTQSSDGNKSAMVGLDEVVIPSAYGSATKTVLTLRLTPRLGSPLCTAVTYTTTTVTTTAGPTAASNGSAAGSGSVTTAAAGAASAAPSATAASNSSVASGTTVASGAASGAAATSAAAPPPTTAAAGNGSASSNATSGRRKREADFEALMLENEDETENLLQRNRRLAVGIPAITLPASTIAAITSSISLTNLITTTLSSNGLSGITVTVVTVGATSNAACNLECNRILMTVFALFALLAFSSRRST